MYLISQREVNAITKEYPDDLNKLKQAVGASDIISTALECDNSRCKVSFSRLVANPNNSDRNDRLTVKSEKNWLAPINKFNAIFSTSQMQFASLFPEKSEVKTVIMGDPSPAVRKSLITLSKYEWPIARYSRLSFSDASLYENVESAGGLRSKRCS